MKSITEKRTARLLKAGQRLGCNSTIALPSTPGRHQKAKPRKPIKRSGKIKVKRRTPAEMTRIYGTKERRAWLKSKPCVACVLVVPILAASDMEWHSEICHVKTGGTGRKDDAARTWPGCRAHHRMYDTHAGFLGTPEVRAYIAAAADAYDIAWTTRTT